MMNFYRIEPEVAGGWGKNTVFTRSPGKPTVVHKLHYEFAGWLGDELLTSTPCFIVTERLADEIKLAGLSGVLFDEVEVSVSDQFTEFYPNQIIPNFLWLKVNGKFGADDFGIAHGFKLVVSERAIEVLKQRGISNAASITPFDVVQ
jgi:hypothetical protein